MAVLRDLGKKIKGKAQKFRGDNQVRSGYPIHGAINRLKGSVNESIADMRLRSRNRGY